MKTVYVADKSLEELECLFSCEIEDDDFCMIIAQNIARKSSSYLQERIRDYDGSRLRGALFALGSAKDPHGDLLSLLKEYLSCDNELCVAEAIDSLKTRAHKDAVEQISRLKAHASPYVRGAVLRYLNFAQGKESYPTLIAALRDEHYIVRENAVDELADLGIVDAIPSIGQLLADPHKDVREAAQRALRELRDRESE